MTGKLPRLRWLLLAIEPLMTVYAVLAAALTVAILPLALLLAIPALGGWQHGLDVWQSIESIWRIWFSHFRVYQWIWTVWQGESPNDVSVLYMRDLELRKAAAQKISDRPIHHYDRREYWPVWTWDELVSALLVAAQLGNVTWVLYVLGSTSIWILSAHVVVMQRQQVAAPTQVAPTAKPEFRPSETQRQEVTFGPWLSSAEMDQLSKKAGVNNLCLIADTGSVRYSQEWTIDPKDSNWAKSQHPNINTWKVEGTRVTFSDNRKDEFCLNLGQPFQFENFGGIIFQFQTDGLRQAMTEKVKKVSLTSVHSAVSANQDLTVK